MPPPQYLFNESQDKTNSGKMTENKEKEEYYCEVCSRKISKEEHEAYDGLCWECWDDQMTEECEFEEGII